MAWGSSPTVGTAASIDGGAGTRSVNPGAPSGSGGILLLLVTSRNQPTSFTTPTGWTLITATASHRCAIFARESDGGANDTPTVSVELAGSGCISATITRWTGGNTTLGSLLSGSVASVFGSAPGGINIPAISPATNNCLVLRGGLTKNDSDGPYFAAPSGDTFLCEDTHTSGYGEDLWACWVYRIQTTAASVSAGQIDSDKTSSDSYAIAAALTSLAASDRYVKLLAHSSAASATGVEGVVLNAARDTVIGEFTGQAFEAALEGSPGEAVLLIDVADITPDGNTLTTSDAPIVFAYNSTDGTVGEGIASVIEV